MWKDFTKHISHYISLLGVLFACLIGFLFFSYDKSFETALCISGGASFVVWGIIHHHIHEDLHPKIVLEYLATAVLGVVVLLVVIWS